MHRELATCKELALVERFVLAHNIVPGEVLPRPCTAHGCTFAQNRETAAAELAEMLATEAALNALTTKAGKAAFSRQRMKHARCHSNVQPGVYSSTMFHHHFRDQILDLLHMGKLGIPKTPWKHGIYKNASDDACELIGEKLAEWKHPLDTKRANDGRVKQQKWFTGEAFSTFCAGESGSPGGPIAIAQLVKIIADDMQHRGVTRGSGTAESEADAAAEAAAVAEAGKSKPKPKPKPKSSFAAWNASKAGAVQDAVLAGEDTGADVLQASVAALKHIPTAMELAADPADLALIRGVFGSRAQTLINTLLSFDAFFNWYCPMVDSIPLFADEPVKEQRVFDNMCSAIDIHDICSPSTTTNRFSSTVQYTRSPAAS